MNLDQDPRWHRFNDRSHACPCCGQSFNGVFDIGYDHPDPWPHGNRDESGLDLLTIGDDVLGSELCIQGEYRYIRCVLVLPLIVSDQYFAFGPLGSVSVENFDAYVASEAQDATSVFDGCFAWLMNALPSFETANPLPCNLIPGDDGTRPRLEVHDGAHKLSELQKSGITFDHLLDIYAASGQDIRPHLIDA